MRISNNSGIQKIRNPKSTIRNLPGDAEIREFTARYRTSTRVRTLEGVRVRAIALPDEDPPGPAVRPTLEEAYLAEIDLADREVGLDYKPGRFAFLHTAFAERRRRDGPPFQGNMP